MKPEEWTGIGFLISGVVAGLLSIFNGKGTKQNKPKEEEPQQEVSPSSIDSIFKLQSQMIQDTSEQLAVIKTSLEESEKKNEKLESMIDDIRGQYQNLQESFNKLSIQNTDLINENRKLSVQVQELNTRLEAIK
ncbi:MAG: hypothetical protein WBP82_11375 [Leuconostoc mesenteroides]